MTTFAPEPSVRDVPSLAQMRERCGTAERQVRRKAYASEAEMTQYRPDETEADSIWAWCYYYAQLVRFLGREEIAELEGDGADGSVLAALDATPVAVPVSSGATTLVYPKSLGALLEFHARERQLLWISARYASMRTDVQELAPELLDLLPRVAEEVARQSAMIAWMATHEGPGLPYEPSVGEPPEIPAEVLAFDPVDVIRINQAFVQVNTVRLQGLERLVQPPKTSGSSSRPSWSVFVGALAMKWQADPKRLMWDYPLATLLATVKLSTPPEMPDRAEEG